MARRGVNEIVSHGRISMERILMGRGYSYKTIKEVALHVGLSLAQVREHLIYLKTKGQIPKESPFYRQ